MEDAQTSGFPTFKQKKKAYVAPVTIRMYLDVASLKHILTVLQPIFSLTDKNASSYSYLHVVGFFFSFSVHVRSSRLLNAVDTPFP